MEETNQSVIVNKILNATEEQLEQFLDGIQEFDDLHYFMEATTKFDKAARKDKGFRDSFTKIYDDRTHFIYELLQNAEDAMATDVCFKLNEDSLEFSHNGTQIFNLDDIKGVTGWGNSTKKDDKGTKIGKFGIGFKSVYGYTDEPEIYSRDYNFKIKDFFVPEKIPAKPNFDVSKTLFILPFNYENKTALKAYEEIKKGLSEISPETLLFLNKIKTLKWNIEGKEYCLSKKQSEHTFNLYKDDELVAKYLRFDGKAQYYDQQSNTSKELPISLAYKLSLEKKKTIIPETEMNNVYTFFKVKNEYAKIRFLINALFELTQARDKLVSDSEINEEILSQIADLQIETMEYLRDNGYLTTDFLGVLPNSQDALSKMYEVFHKKLVDLFNEESYTPAISGDFLPANGLFRGSIMYTNGPHISEFISDTELVKILEADDFEYKYNLEPPLWVKNALQNSPSAYFLNDLDLNDFGVKEFYKWLADSKYKDTKKEVWRRIIEKKDFNDLVKLYRMLYQYFKENYKWADDLINLPLFRCTDQKMYSKSDTVYILPEEDIPEDILASYHFIDKKSFGTARQKEDVYNLFKNKFRIEEFSEKAICEEMLKKYQSPDNSTKVSEHIQDIKLLLKHYENNKSEFKNKLKKISFILTTDNVYVSIDKVYSDIRYGNKHNLMKEVKDILDLSEINIVYEEKLSQIQVEKFISILNDLGIHKFLWIDEYDHNRNNPLRDNLYSVYNWSHITGVSKDYGMYGLDEIIRAANERKISWSNVSKLIWMSIFDIEQPENYVYSCYRANQRDSYHQVPATFIQILSNNAWILTRDGSLQKPKDVTFEDLPDNWIRPKSCYKHTILEKIGFVKNSQQQIEEEQRKDQTAQAAGFENAKEAEELKKLRDEMTEAGITTDEMRSYIQRKQEKNNKQLPEAESKNPERRQEKILQENESADEQTYEIRERSVRTTDTQVRKDARQYLTDMYTDEDGEMCCQMCRQELPFKKKDGQYYFETTQIFNNMSKEDKHQYLALCPNCAAEYDEWVKKDEKTSEMLKNKIAERKYMKGEKSVSMDFYIHDGLKTLYFTGKHYLDMRTVVCPDADIDENQSFWASLGGNVVMPLEVGDTVRSEHFGEGIVCSIGSNAFGPTADVDFSEGRKTINIERLEKKIS